MIVQTCAKLGASTTAQGSTPAASANDGSSCGATDHVRDLPKENMLSVALPEPGDVRLVPPKYQGGRED